MSHPRRARPRRDPGSVGFTPPLCYLRAPRCHSHEKSDVSDPTDRLIRGITQGSPYRVIAARTTTLVAEGLRCHGLVAGGAEALARGTTSLVLTAVMDKEWYRISGQWMGRGPLGTLNVDVRAPGDLRAFATDPGFAGGIEQALGAGTLSVLRQKQSGHYTQGQVALTTRDVDGDLESYLRVSDQVPTAMRVLTSGGSDGLPGDVIGVMVQPLPGGNAASLREVVAPALLDRSLSTEGSLEEVAARAVPGLSIDWMGEIPLQWACGCSAERVHAGVKLLGPAEIDEMIEIGEEPEVRCDYCTTVHVVRTEGLRTIRAEFDN